MIDRFERIVKIVPVESGKLIMRDRGTGADVEKFLVVFRRLLIVPGRLARARLHEKRMFLFLADVVSA